MRETVINYLKQNKVNVIEMSDEELARMNEWEQWYRGNVDGFHEFDQWNGKKHTSKKRKSLFMAAKVCQDWADLLLNERVDITVAAKGKKSSQKAQETLDGILDYNNFYVKANNLVETAYAIGGGFFVEYYNANEKKTKINYITQDNAYPITIDNGVIKEIAFSSKVTVGNTEYIYINIHTLDKNFNYVIDNVFISKNSEKQYEEESKEFYVQNGIKPKWETHSPVPLFQQIKPNIVNRLNYDGAYGVSVFNTALDAFKKCDSDFTAYYCEVALGKKRIFVRDTVTTVNFDEDNEPVRAFQDDDIYYSIPDYEDGQPIIESNMALRVAELDTALQNSLNLISQECGFGSEGYKWEGGNATTATQIISENSKMFRTLQKHELVMRKAIVDMVKGLLFVDGTLGGSGVESDVTVTVDFDDSIIEDTAELKRQALQDLTVGNISKQQYFRDVYKLDDKQAKEFVTQMLTEMNEEMQMLQTESEPMPE